MSSKDLLSPYINRLKAINQQMSYARLELCCKDQKVTVKKNISTPLFARLERRTETRADEARVETQ